VDPPAQRSHHNPILSQFNYMPHSPSWYPTASFTSLKQRNQILATIRAFFAARNVWEVDTPLLCHSTATDPHIGSLSVSVNHKTCYLQTSPEFAMKRLLAAGSGSIYQICKAFRAEEQGRLHNTEFTMLEWYRIGFDHHQLMDEMDALLQAALKTESAERITYRDVFKKYLDFDPLLADIAEFEKYARQQGFTNIQNPHSDDIDFWRHLLMSHCIEPQLGKTRPVFIFDFPTSQAALAKIRHDNPPVAERFEVYFQGIELANGYHELTDAIEQEKRFKADNQRRKAMQLPLIPADEHLLAALQKGFPECAGVALGIDRLVMLAIDAKIIGEVISFL
jgi:lysyl-tRNA synthetase class 2